MCSFLRLLRSDRRLSPYVWRKPPLPLTPLAPPTQLPLHLPPTPSLPRPTPHSHLKLTMASTMETSKEERIANGSTARNGVEDLREKERERLNKKDGKREDRLTR
ncbi:hypothetical protein WMY93_020668 [Mugilogobius chulae]|uniref:Uncharacterized protein n=1 Tax=Mugilogobius chulae TaxID=88201 RepID=A0AAW0N8I1_9GOBI